MALDKTKFICVQDLLNLETAEYYVTQYFDINTKRIKIISDIVVDICEKVPSLKTKFEKELIELHELDRRQTDLENNLFG